MTEQQPYPETGWYKHVHHDKLLDWCFGYTERVDHIKREKPPAEHDLRLRLMKPWVGEIPKRLQVAMDNLLAQHCGILQCDDAYADYLPELEAQHKLECPDCPWDGKTIFTSAEEWL